ncbi:MAG: hypothetical protein LC131_00250 [Anaerolineae bacterium]|nr:hypothetical protein [Anaerolineae bacterium]
MPTVIATVGASDANSYVTVAEADAYFAEQFGYSAWDLVVQADREACVITASRSLDSYMVWAGQRATDVQSMEWPRSGSYDRYGNPIDDDVIPNVLKQAVFETAFIILTKGGLEFGGRRYDKVKVAVVDVTFSRSQDSSGIPKYIEELLSGLGLPLLQRDGEMSVVRLERV